MKPVLLLNPNGSRAATDAMLVIARRHLPDVVGWTNPRGPRMITTADALGRAAEQVAGADLPDASGVIVAAFGDPGVQALARRRDCPVVGIGAAAARAAAQGGAAFAVATTTPGLRAPIDALMRAEGTGGQYLGAFITTGDPLALLHDQVALDTALVAACARAGAAGAAHVIIGGGPLAAAAARIAAQVPVALIQPLPEACRALTALLA